MVDLSSELGAGGAERLRSPLPHHSRVLLLQQHPQVSPLLPGRPQDHCCSYQLCMGLWLFLRRNMGCLGTRPECLLSKAELRANGILDCFSGWDWTHRLWRQRQCLAGNGQGQPSLAGPGFPGDGPAFGSLWPQSEMYQM